MANQESTAGRDRGGRIGQEGRETRKQQIARRLRLSERVLEQYYQSKQAELEDEVELAFVPGRNEQAGREKRI